MPGPLAARILGNLAGLHVASSPAMLGTPAANPPRSFSVLEQAFVRFAGRHGLLIVRLSLGLVFVWFGALKVCGVSPVAGLVAKVLFALPPRYGLPLLGWTEIVVGLSLVSRVGLRATMWIFFAHMSGTFLVLLLYPDLAFQGSNPLVLTTLGEFVVKNVVLMAAGLAVVSTSLSRTSTEPRRRDASLR
jgi:putative oxidoreductase